MTDETTPDQPEQTPDETPNDSAATPEPIETFSTESLEAPQDLSAQEPSPAAASAADAPHAEENLAKLKEELRALELGHLKDGVRNYKEFFEHAKNIGALFKSLKPLPHVEREQLWLEFSTLCDDVRAVQNSEREEQKLASLELRGKLEAHLVELSQAGPNAKYADDFSKLAEQLKAIREEFSGTKEKQSPLIPKDREALWKLWKHADDAIWSHRKAVRAENYTAGKEHMTVCAELATTGDPFDCHKKIKELRPWQRGAELAREQRDEIRKSLDHAWEAAAARIEAGRAERKQQYEQWTERTSGLLEEWEQKLEKMRDFRIKLEEQITRLNDMETNARTDEFADQVAGWRKEKEDKLLDVGKNIIALAERIESMKKRMK